MKKYMESFQEALDFTDSIAGGMSNYPLKIEPELVIDMRIVVNAIAQDFAEFLPHSNVLPGQCFRVARELSHILFDLGIRHTVTIGNVELADGLYVGLTLNALKNDLAMGYQIEFIDGRPVGIPINAHAGITLENGCVIDATVLASQHRKSTNATEYLSFEDAVFYTGKPGTPIIRHIPMLTGLVYHQKVLTAPEDGDFHNYCHWFEDYPRLMGRLDMLRLVPVDFC